MPPYRIGLKYRRKNDEVHTNNSFAAKPSEAVKTIDDDGISSERGKEGGVGEVGGVGEAGAEGRDEYAEGGDSSDEEGRVNRRGAVPPHWYDEYPHLGYDAAGARLLRPPHAHADHIDAFLRRCEEPEFWRTVQDPETGQQLVLSAGDLALLQRLREARPPSALHDAHAAWLEWFSCDVLAAPVRAFPDHKRSFLPSGSERAQLARLVHALRMGWAKSRRQLAEERRARRLQRYRYYDLWGSGAGAGEEESAGGARRGPAHIPAPRRPPPSHAESYRPPAEYLLDAAEMRAWDALAETPWRRKYTFLPQRHSSLRAVPAYPRYTRERFLRCLDLYLAPRAIKMRLTVDAASLVPALPSPRSLQPFPTARALQYRGHTGAVRALAPAPCGQYLLSGAEDGLLIVWEVSTGRRVWSVDVGAEVRGAEGGEGVETGVTCVAWCGGALSLVAACAGRHLVLYNGGASVAGAAVAASTDLLLQLEPAAAAGQGVPGAARWERVEAAAWARGVRVRVWHVRELASLSWHARGDYLCVTARSAEARALLVHQVSRRRSLQLLRRARGQLQCAAFHPRRPLLAVCTQRACRLYELARQQLLRKLVPGAQWLSGVAWHPLGDNLLLTTHEGKVLWFDLDLSARPYQALRLHRGAVRHAAFSAAYPLFATCGDDGRAIVHHAMVYQDLLRNPLLVPLKALVPGAQEPATAQAAQEAPRQRPPALFALAFHPRQPWLWTAGADHTVSLYT